MSHHSRMIAVLVTLLAVGASDAWGGVSRAFEFNVDGVLPSSEPEMTFLNNTGLPESSLFSVSGGFLHQKTLDLFGAPSYFYASDFNGDFDPTEAFSMEARLLVKEISGFAGVGFQASNGAFHFGLNFTSTGIEFQTQTSPIAIPIDFSVIHTYRIDAAGGSSTERLYIDGVLRATAIAGATRQNFFSFGDGFSSVYGAEVDFDYVRVNVTPAAAVPEPSTLSMLAISSTGLFLFGRKQVRSLLGRPTKAR